MTKKIFMIAGPNGSGKTTTATSLLPDLLRLDEFLNADEIARGLAPLNPESVSVEAGKLMLKRFRDLLTAQQSFAFETTGAAKTFLMYFKKAREENYEINLMYLWLPSPDLAIERVAHRVAQGGHNIPEETIRRRYVNGATNIVNHYLPFVDNALIVDNSSGTPKPIARKDNKGEVEIENQMIWERLKKASYVPAH